MECDFITDGRRQYSWQEYDNDCYVYFIHRPKVPVSLGASSSRPLA